MQFVSDGSFETADVFAGDRQFEMPAVVVATGAAAQRDVVPCQPQVGGVEVLGLQPEQGLCLRCGDTVDTGGQIRNLEASGNIELALDLAMHAWFVHLDNGIFRDSPT